MRVLAILLLPILLACGQGVSGNRVLPKFAPEVGSDWRQWTVTEQIVTQELSGTSQTTTQRVGLLTRYRIAAVGTDGVITMQATWDSIAYRQQGDGALLQWTSADTAAETPDMVVGYAAIVGQSFLFHIRANGTIVGVEGGDSLRRRISDCLAERDELGGFLDRSLAAAFSDSSLIASLADLFSIYPDEHVAIDDTWSRDGRIMSIVALDVNNRYRMKERSRGHLTITVEGSMETNEDDPLIEFGDVKFRYDMKGSMTGTIEVDETSGWAIRSQREQSLQGRVRSYVGKEMKEGVDIPVSVTSRVTTTTAPVAMRTPGEAG